MLPFVVPLLQGGPPFDPPGPPGPPADLETAAYYVLLAFGGAWNAKALAPTLVFAIGLLLFYPNMDAVRFMMLFYVPAVLYANFRS